MGAHDACGRVRPIIIEGYEHTVCGGYPEGVICRASLPVCSFCREPKVDCIETYGDRLICGACRQRLG